MSQEPEPPRWLKPVLNIKQVDEWDKKKALLFLLLSYLEQLVLSGILNSWPIVSYNFRNTCMFLPGDFVEPHPNDTAYEHHIDRLTYCFFHNAVSAYEIEVRSNKSRVEDLDELLKSQGRIMAAKSMETLQESELPFCLSNPFTLAH